MPFAVNGSAAKANDPSTWSTFNEAAERYRRGGYAGVGYEFSADDPFVGIDLDGCRDPATGAIADWAKQIIVDLDTYAEVSPSKTGVKLFARGTLPKGAPKKWEMKDAPAVCDKAPGVEVYDRARYFCVTGWRLEGQSEPQERQTQLDALLAQYQPKRGTAERADQNGHHGADFRHGQPSIADRARKYMAKVPEAVAGQFGHDATFAAACLLVLDFNMSPDEAWPVFCEWNEKCTPPWSEHELRRKLEEANKQPGERGAKLVAERNGNTAPGRGKRVGNSLPTLSDDATDLRSPSGRTDIANARRFALLHGENVRWVDPWGKFCVWDDRRWALDAERRIDAMAKEVAQAVWKQTAILLPDLDYGTAKELTSFARYTAGARGVANMLTLAKSESNIPILPDKLDADPWALNIANGTLDLRTGKLRPHDRTELLTKLCPVAFDQAAVCPLWTQTIDRIFGGNVSLCGFSQRLLGSAVVGTVIEHILPIFWGDGSNGKGLFLETILDVLGGDFACKIGSDVLLASKSDRHPTELADLHGKRLVVASETDDGRRLREGLLKEITGGDTIKARRMREDFWQFRPSHTLLLLTNHRPTVRGTDHGIWRRLCLVPFVQKFWDADRGETGPAELQADKHLRDKLQAEHAGILRWLVDGCLEWQADGLAEPAEVRAATAEYRTSQDVLGAFLADRCIEGDQFTAKAGLVYAEYRKWCEANGEDKRSVMSQRRFGDSMTEREIERYKSDGIWYRGIALLNHPVEF